MAENETTGSPHGESVYLAIGFLRRPHGVGGEMIMDLHTDFPERIKAGRKIYVGGNYGSCTLENVRPYKDGVLVTLRGYETPEAVGRFRNQWVYVKSKDVPPLPKGQFYKYQLLDLEIIEENGSRLGILSEILETGANDVYVVKNDDGKEILLPAIPSVILKVELEAHRIIVRLLDGLI